MIEILSTGVLAAVLYFGFARYVQIESSRSEQAIRALAKRIEDHIDQRLEKMLELLNQKYVSEHQQVEFSEDELYEKAREAVIIAKEGSTAFLQKTFGIGYSRAARLLDILESDGIVGPHNNGDPRKVLVER